MHSASCDNAGITCDLFRTTGAAWDLRKGNNTVDPDPQSRHLPPVSRAFKEGQDATAPHRQRRPKDVLYLPRSSRQDYTLAQSGVHTETRSLVTSLHFLANAFELGKMQGN